MRAPKVEEGGTKEVAPADRFFTYKHYLDGNGELIDKEIMKIIAQAMIRNKPDSYCQAWDVDTTGISELVAALRFMYDYYGVNPAARHQYFSRFAPRRTPRENSLSKAFSKLFGSSSRNGKPSGKKPPPRNRS